MDSVGYTKKALKLVFSVSILSSFLLFCSSLFPLISYYFQNSYNKNYMFLLCNGILGFILKISGPMTTQRSIAPKERCYSHVEDDYQQDKNIKDFGNQQREVTPNIEMSSTMAEKTNIEFEGSLALVTTKEENGNDELLITKDVEVEESRKENVLITAGDELSVDRRYNDDHHHEDEEEEDDDDDEFKMMKGDELSVDWRYNDDDHHDDEEEDEFKMMSPEELNKRCDDFIKKMKLNLRVQ